MATAASGLNTSPRVSKQPASSVSAASAAVSRAASLMAVISSAGELRLALLHEGAAALDVVGAGEALRDEALRGADIALGVILQQLGDGALDRRNGEGRISGDGGRIVLDEILELAGRHHLIDEAHEVRLLRGELLRREEQLLR